MKYSTAYNNKGRPSTWLIPMQAAIPWLEIQQLSVRTFLPSDVSLSKSVKSTLKSRPARSGQHEQDINKQKTMSTVSALRNCTIESNCSSSDTPTLFCSLLRLSSPCLFRTHHSGSALQAQQLQSSASLPFVSSRLRCRRKPPLLRHHPSTAKDFSRSAKYPAS